MSSTKSEFVHTTPEYWSFVMPTEIRVSKKWHDSVTLDERKHALGSILSSLMMKGDMKIFKDYPNINGQIYMAKVDESHIYETADSQSEYYKKIKEKTQEIANWDLDQEETIKSFGLQIMQFGQKMDENNVSPFDLMEYHEEELRRRGSGHTITSCQHLNIKWESQQLWKMRERKMVKTARKEAKHIANVTVTPSQDQEYDIDDVVKRLEECGEKPKKKQKKKGKKVKDSKSGDKQEKGIETKKVPDQLAVAQEEPNLNTQSHDQPVDDQNLPTDQKSSEIPSAGLECSTCFEPRIRTFALLPCGHATFCEKCATHFCDSEDKKCPTCRAMTTGRVRLFL